MVFVIVQIRCGTKLLKEWYGTSVPENITFFDLYNEFTSGKYGQFDDKYINARINVSVGRQKSDLTRCDPSISLCDTVSFLGPFVEFVVDHDPALEADNAEKTKTDAFKILMSAASKASFLPDKHTPVSNNKQKLFNDLIDWLASQKVGFMSSNKEGLGKNLINTLSDVFWYIDGNHSTLASRGCPVPSEVEHFKGYKDPVSHKKKRFDPSMLQESSLRSHATALLLLTDQSYLQRDQWRGVHQVLERLAQNLKKYADYLHSHKESSHKHAEKKFVGEKQRWEVLTGKHHIIPGPLAR